MERPSHTLAAQMGGTPAQIAKNRAISLIVVTVVTGSVLLLLIFGMTTSMKKKLEDIAASVEDQVVAKPPPPPPPDMVKPPPPFIPPPDFQVSTSAPAGITTTSQKPTPPPPPAPPAPPPPAPPAIAPTGAEAILSTQQIKPDYPAISKRLNEEGTVIATITLDVTGNVTDATVQTSSGKPRLDQAALDWLKAKHWKWKPATQNGKPIESRTLVKVIWSLKEEQ